MIKYLLIFVFISGCVTKIPADSMTATRMYSLKKRAEIYFEKNRKMPQNILDLPNLSDSDNKNLDAWGRQYQLKKESETEVSFLSLGLDGAQGGYGENADIFAKISLSAKASDSSQVNSKWIVPPKKL
jgi:hypothetical protein